MPRSRALIEIARGSSFLLIGGLAFLVDAGLYNLLVYWGGEGVLHDLPLVAKIISIATASAATYIGNKLLTYRDRPTRVSAKQIAIFIAINLVAGGLQLACLGFSRYVLHLDDAVADNVFGTLIGQVLATAFRYVTYGRFVFPAQKEAVDGADAATDVTDGTNGTTGTTGTDETGGTNGTDESDDPLPGAARL